MVNTNATMMKGDMLNSLVKSKFDYILISYHAGEESSYKRLMTGDINKVDENILALYEKKAQERQDKPTVAFNFALQRENANQYKSIIDKAIKLGISEIVINKYYGGRNKLDDNKVSFEFDPENGNKILDEIYNYASNKNILLVPPMPEYWKVNEKSWVENDVDYSKQCNLPWMNLHFNPVLDDIDAHYVGVCNRIELFKIHYNKFLLITDNDVEKLWNHPLLIYMRKTVNEVDNINPICKFCKNNSFSSLRSRYPDKYAGLRDNAVYKFFIKASKNMENISYDGLVLLSENPHSDKKYLELVS